MKQTALALLLSLMACSHLQAQSVAEEAVSLSYDSVLGSVFIGWEATEGRIYFVQYSENLSDWSYYPTIHLGEDYQVAFAYQADASKLFFRLRYADDLPSGVDPAEYDFDDDGISNLDELKAGTDPFENIDLNANSVPDDWEAYYQITDLSEDRDLDGLSALEEYQQGTSPNDYYNGVLPQMTQIESPQDTLAMQITNEEDQLLENAPVLFQSAIGGHLIAEFSDGPGLTERTILTNENGVATAYFVAP